ncbi:unnamed protein product [Orchesella dallaii]|uniref:Uncharacterized protein n=1 Tax=Orchesella dallaii TaxID=48710 RepID=A0ABP1R460_9HEXA
MLLVISYADQLVKLKLETAYPVPPLQPSVEYNMFEDGRVFQVGKTSEIVFKKLKEFSREFPLNTITPSLETLTLWELDKQSCPNIRHITKFIDSCCHTLEEIIFDISWKDLLGFDNELLQQFSGMSLLPTSETKVSRLTYLEVYYPKMINMKILAKTFLVKFPALTCLHLPDLNAENDPTVFVEEPFCSIPDLSQPSGVLAMARMERDLALAHLNHFIELKYPGMRIEEAIVLEMSTRHGVWET